MWREYFESFGLPCFLGEPASPEVISHLEQSLSVVLPSELRELLLEMNGVDVRPAFFGDIGEEDAVLQVIWVVDEILHRNRELRELEEGLEPDFGLSKILFFASEPNGDFLGYAVDNGVVVDPDLIVISHEDYENRYVQRGSLQEYLTILMEAFQ